jgi:hypothetical protein
VSTLIPGDLLGTVRWWLSAALDRPYPAGPRLTLSPPQPRKAPVDRGLTPVTPHRPAIDEPDVG